MLLFQLSGYEGSRHLSAAGTGQRSVITFDNICADVERVNNWKNHIFIFFFEKKSALEKLACQHSVENKTFVSTGLICWKKCLGCRL